MTEPNTKAHRPATRRGAAPKPLRMFLIVLIMVFGVEAVIMLCMRAWAWKPDDTLLVAITDSLLLTAFLSPMLWFTIVLPLRRVSEHRGWLLARVHSAREDERARIARDLHDDLGQQLTAVLIGLRTVEQSDNLEVARARAVDTREVAGKAMDAVRRLAHGLRSVELAELGLVPMVERLCESVLAPAGIHAEVRSDIPAGLRLAGPAESEVYRILQEAITNILRHSGATEALIRIELRGDLLRAEVQDNGRGFAPAVAGSKVGMGLRGMAERANLLDGAVQVQSTPNVGTTIFLAVPRVLEGS